MSKILGTAAYVMDACFVHPWRTLPSLTAWDYQVFASWTLFYVIVYLIMRPLYKEQKYRAWILTLWCSLVTSILGAVVWLGFIQSGFAFEFYLGETIYSRSLILCFAAMMIVDSVIGQVEYREYFEVLTGYVHHSLYFLLCLFMLGKNKSNDLGLHYIEEIPTLLLALGKIGIYRTDLGYGISFFFFRIFVHIGIILNILLRYPWDSVAAVMTILRIFIFCLHLHWAINWYKGYQKRVSRRKEKSQ